jgi:hypothetical protein
MFVLVVVPRLEDCCADTNDTLVKALSQRHRSRFSLGGAIRAVNEASACLVVVRMA